MSVFFSASELRDLIQQVERGGRLDLEAGIRLMRSNDLLALGYMANLVRERKNGNKTYFIVNRHFNYTHACVNLTDQVNIKTNQAFSLKLEEIEKAVCEAALENISELHIVGELIPELPYDYYLNMLKCVKKILPQVSLQAFTAKEIDNFTQITGYSVTQVLMDLRQAGLDSLHEGGAEIFSPKVRALICEKKVSAERWLEIQEAAHRLGMRTTATMLYGHNETVEERIEYLVKLRELQDKTAGFFEFSPLPFYPENTQMEGYLGVGNTTGFEDLKILAVSRILLDNFDHIKTFWITLGHKLAQVSLAFGVDNLAGTVVEEQTIHAAGVETGQAMSKKALLDLIQKAGREAHQCIIHNA